MATGSSFLNRVSGYSVVSGVLEKSKEYYNWGKENSKVVAYAESRLEGGYNWVLPKVATVLETSAYKAYAQPLLTKADGLSVSVLDRVEARATQLKHTYDVTKDTLGEKATTVKNSTYEVLDGAQKKIVTPVDQYLKDSVLGLPYNLTLDVTENVLQRFLPQDQKEDEAAKKNVVGPISRTTYLTKKLQHQTLQQWHTLSAKTPEKLHLQQAVELLKHAAHTLDDGVANVVIKSASLLAETPKEVKAKTLQAAAAVRSAVDLLSKQLPQRLLLSSEPNGEGKESVLKSVSKLLHDAGATLSDYVAKGETVPAQLLNSTLSQLRKVLDTLGAVAKSGEETKEVHNKEVADISGSN